MVTRICGERLCAAGAGRAWEVFVAVGALWGPGKQRTDAADAFKGERDML